MWHVTSSLHPPLSSLKHGCHTVYLIRLLWELNEIVHVKGRCAPKTYLEKWFYCHLNAQGHRNHKVLLRVLFFFHFEEKHSKESVSKANKAYIPNVRVNNRNYKNYIGIPNCLLFNHTIHLNMTELIFNKDNSKENKH